MKFKQGLKKLKRIEKSPKEYFGISQLFEKQALEELITSSNCFFIFRGKFQVWSDYLLVCLTSGSGFGSFW